MIWPKRVLEVCAIFSRDLVKEMMRNANCFKNLFLLIDRSHIPKEASKSNPLFVH